MRTCGVLMPVSSLAGRYGIGGFGQEAYDFVDFLEAAGQGLWQILPLGPTGYGDSPYQSCSAFAGNPYFIDPALLVKDGLLEEAELRELEAPCTDRIDYGRLYQTRYPMLRRACAAFAQKRAQGDEVAEDYQEFLEKNWDWLEDYVLYRAAQKKNDMKPWQQWPEDLRCRQPEALDTLRREMGEELDFWRFVEYMFSRQWKALREYADEKHVKILGDMPIYVSMDSSDAWAGRELFETDEDGEPTRVAGCPPDYFCQDGQFWGNPLYDWEYHKKTGYEWWLRRIRRALERYDLVRIDHFRAFDTYWSIPAEAETAREGKWMEGPGLPFFETVREKLGDLPLVAEDLGDLFESVRVLLRGTGLPGMKVLQFAFSHPGNEYLPHFHIPNCLVYTGTHDNNTLRGWLEQDASPEQKQFAKAYLGVKDDRDLPEAILRAALASCGDTCVIPLADWLGLGAEARINTPGVVGPNWAWRTVETRWSPELARRMRDTCGLYARVR